MVLPAAEVASEAMERSLMSDGVPLSLNASGVKSPSTGAIG